MLRADVLMRKLRWYCFLLILCYQQDAGIPHLKVPAGEETLELPPDLVSSDYWISAEVKKMLQTKKFGSNEEAIGDIEAYFESKNKLFYKNGIEK
ncbi:hypothetical protein KM043_009728 [Ampulex compressa]|nr:hypothetical protein KM043_009728 [Ampulex compressa]